MIPILTNRPLLATMQQCEMAGFSDCFSSALASKHCSSKLVIIPVHGLLLHRIEGFGSCYETIRHQLRHALASPEIEHIILDIDSGGGEVNGLFDLVDDIVEVRSHKPITALVNEVAYSAAYLIASSASQIVASQTASVGSVGVIVAHLDQSKANEKMGFIFTQVYAGKHKADCSPHQPLSEQAKSDLQYQVNETYEHLITVLARNRQMPVSLFRETEAQIYSSSRALPLKLIDQIYPPHKYIEELLMSDKEASIEFENLVHVQMVDAERDRAKSILNLCKQSGLNDVALELIESGASVEEARRVLFDKMVASSSHPIINAVGDKQCEDTHLIQSMVRGMGAR